MLMASKGTNPIITRNSESQRKALPYHTWLPQPNCTTKTLTSLHNLLCTSTCTLSTQLGRRHADHSHSPPQPSSAHPSPFDSYNRPPTAQSPSYTIQGPAASRELLCRPRQHLGKTLANLRHGSADLSRTALIKTWLVRKLCEWGRLPGGRSRVVTACGGACREQEAASAIRQRRRRRRRHVD